MLKAVHVPSRAQSSEQSCSEDDDMVLFAVSNAHLTGPSFVALDLLYDVTSADSSGDVTGMTNCSSSSSGDIASNFVIIVDGLLLDKTCKPKHHKHKSGYQLVAADFTLTFRFFPTCT